ncbi:MAG: hypothetical protein Q9192_003448 [Flavoplaca navasiana]
MTTSSVGSSQRPIYISDSAEAEDEVIYIRDSAEVEDEVIHIRDSAEAEDEVIHIRDSAEAEDEVIHIRDSAEAEDEVIHIRDSAEAEDEVGEAEDEKYDVARGLEHIDNLKALVGSGAVVTAVVKAIGSSRPANYVVVSSFNGQGDLTHRVKDMSLDGKKLDPWGRSSKHIESEDIVDVYGGHFVGLFRRFEGLKNVHERIWSWIVGNLY